jgi:pyridoxine kinase
MPRVLSVQSHVVFGVVGNKAAVFPLQLRGFTVDPLNTCQLSNHTGYCSFAGSRTPADDLAAIWASLEAIGATDEYVALLTGYIGRADVLACLLEKVKALRASRGASITILCDPVCGDNGKLYVPEDVPPLYRDMLQYSNIVTPNGFEAGLLSGIEPHDMATAKRCAAWFHEHGPRLVIVTSVDVKSSAEHEGEILVLASYRTTRGASLDADGADGTTKTAAAWVPRVAGKFSGTGDLFAALVLSEWEALEATGDLTHHLSRWCSTLLAVLSETKPGTIKQAAGFSELDVVGSLDVLRHGTDAPVTATLV